MQACTHAGMHACMHTCAHTRAQPRSPALAPRPHRLPPGGVDVAVDDLLADAEAERSRLHETHALPVPPDGLHLGIFAARGSCG